jgi:hypothetical protein
MARTRIEQQMISKKIMKLRGEGYKRKQATAIALRMYRDGELPRAAKKPKPPNRLRKSTRSRRQYRSR